MTADPTPQGLMIHVNWDALSPTARQAILELLRGDAATESPALTDEAFDEDEGEEHSYPITPVQVHQLVERLDDKTCQLLRAVAENLDPDDARYGYIGWPEAKEITATSGWAHFAKGPLSGLHRSLRAITGDKDANLLIRYGDWRGPEQDWGEDATLFVDGRALQSLREYFKIKA